MLLTAFEMVYFLSAAGKRADYGESSVMESEGTAIAERPHIKIEVLSLDATLRYMASPLFYF